jgi:hypothetical protein
VVVLYSDLNKAIKEGWMVHKSFVGGGYLLKQATPKGFIMAICELKPPEHAWDDEC